MLLAAAPHAHDAATPLEQAKFLTSGIRNCSDDWRRMQKLLNKYASIVNPIHACAVLSTLTQAGQESSSSDVELQAFYQQLMVFLYNNLHQLGARELSNVLGAMAKLRMRPSQDMLSNMVEAVLQQIDRHSGQDCGSTAWALARLNYYPSSSWLSAFMARCEACLSRMDTQALSNLLWALARWDHRPSQAFLESAAAAVAASMPLVSSQGLANMLWAFAKLRYLPPPTWVDRYWVAVGVQTSQQQRGPSISAAELSLIVFAAGKLGCRPPAAATLTLLIDRLNDRMCDLDFPGASCAMWGFCMLRHRPEPLMHAWFSHTQRRMELWTSSSAALHAAEEERPRLDGKSLSNALYALQQLEAASGARATAPTAWLQSAVDASSALMGAMDVRSLAVSGLCLAKLGAAVDGAWLAAYASASHRALGSMNPAEVANVLCALSRFRHVPSEEFMCAFMTYIHEEMLGFKAKELANSCLALAHLSRTLMSQPQASSGQWESRAASLWQALHADIRCRWQLLPSSPAQARSISILHRALQLARQNASWLLHVT